MSAASAILYDQFVSASNNLRVMNSISEIPRPDIVINMCCNVDCPYLPYKGKEDWGLEDPTGKSDEEFIKTAKTSEVINGRGVCWMNTRVIDKLDLFKIVDESTYDTYYGCDQNWYTTEWQRRSGCGPSVASNIIFYLNHTRPAFKLGPYLNSKESWLSLMEEIWEYVTPSQEGIPTTKMFYEAVITYAESKGLNVSYDFCDVPKDKSGSPPLSKILDFLERALTKDTPIAFLNLCNGAENNLDRWHWVTIIALEYTEGGNSIFIDILDEGIIKRIDLALWYNTTILGGGFVYFSLLKDVEKNCSQII